MKSTTRSLISEVFDRDRKEDFSPARRFLRLYVKRHALKRWLWFPEVLLWVNGLYGLTHPAEGWEVATGAFHGFMLAFSVSRLLDHAAFVRRLVWDAQARRLRWALLRQNGRILQTCLEQHQRERELLQALNDKTADQMLRRHASRHHGKLDVQ